MYFGGITSFSSHQFTALNGYPNNFWGWGGEDDELRKRMETVNITPSSPSDVESFTSSKGKEEEEEEMKINNSEIHFKDGEWIKDLEDMTIDQKMTHLKANSHWKCMNKWELLEEHTSSWSKNGLSNLNYQIIHQDDSFSLTQSSSNSNSSSSNNNSSTHVSFSTKIQVNIRLNEPFHWTNLRCDINNVEYGIPSSSKNQGNK